jgi:hypothetical protein
MDLKIKYKFKKDNYMAELKKELDLMNTKLEKCDFTLEEHILHVINPLYYWCCEDCFQSDLRNDRIISIGEEKIEDWKIGMR